MHSNSMRDNRNSLTRRLLSGITNEGLENLVRVREGERVPIATPRSNVQQYRPVPAPRMNKQQQLKKKGETVPKFTIPNKVKKFISKYKPSKSNNMVT